MVQRYAVLPGSLLSGLQVFLPGLRNGNPKKTKRAGFSRRMALPGFGDMCKFMPVNLDNSMMKHMKLKLIALLWVTFAVVCTWASDSVVWHHPWWAIPILL